LVEGTALQLFDNKGADDEDNVDEATSRLKKYMHQVLNKEEVLVKVAVHTTLQFAFLDF
jgi:hypothetical protein